MVPSPNPRELLMGPMTPPTGAFMRQRCNLEKVPLLTMTSLLMMNRVCSSGWAVKYCHACPHCCMHWGEERGGWGEGGGTRGKYRCDGCCFLVRFLEVL